MITLILITVIVSALGDQIQPLRSGAEGEEVDLFIRAQGYLGPRDLAQYDDCTPFWISCAGDYKAVWFHMQDFGLSSLDLAYSEFWFYHSSSKPWDTDHLYTEVWIGLEGAPQIEMLDRTRATALHFSAVIIDYDPPIICPDHFWVLANTNLSGNGTPTLILDESGNFTGEPRSFFSYDLENWEPFTSGSVRIESTTWGLLKGLFR